MGHREKFGTLRVVHHLCTRKLDKN
jgi:hypothetical protein